MARIRTRWLAATIGVLLLGSSLTASVALAARPGTSGGPTAPTNLRVLGVAAYSVSLAWDAAKAKTGIAAYKVCCANVSSETFPATSRARPSPPALPGTAHPAGLARDNPATGRRPATR
jgi:hypothetical protein